mmetsp:Transcript_22187/g.48381  ORF Transcript_22187/g.48381 Transcript_22187/m.48381 type:complete len:194 (-) Transcript_22187:208-789(-)
MGLPDEICFVIIFRHLVCFRPCHISSLLSEKQAHQTSWFRPFVFTFPHFCASVYVCVVQGVLSAIATPACRHAARVAERRKGRRLRADDASVLPIPSGAAAAKSLPRPPPGSDFALLRKGDNKISWRMAPLFPGLNRRLEKEFFIKRAQLTAQQLEEVARPGARTFIIHHHHVFSDFGGLDGLRLACARANGQ